MHVGSLMVGVRGAEYYSFSLSTTLSQIIQALKLITTSVRITTLTSVLLTELKAWRDPVHIIFTVTVTLSSPLGSQGLMRDSLVVKLKLMYACHGLLICSSGLDSSSLVDSVTFKTRSFNTRRTNMTSQRREGHCAVKHLHIPTNFTPSHELKPVGWKVKLVFPVL